ncbi:MAG: hypothetical protein ACLU30_02190 [Odoribacter splanchnicus]
MKVRTRQTADYQWLFDGKRQRLHVIREGKSEVVAPRYAFCSLAIPVIFCVLSS